MYGISAFLIFGFLVIVYCFTFILRYLYNLSGSDVLEPSV